MSEEVQSYLVARLTIQVQLSMLAELPTVCTKSMHTPSYQGTQSAATVIEIKDADTAKVILYRIIKELNDHGW